MSLNLIKYENKSALNENEAIADINKVTANDMNEIKLAINDLIYPIGSIIMNISASFDPNSVYGGTWEQWAKGQVPVGVDTEQNEFNKSEKTGGAKTHTLTINEMPSHNHVFDRRKLYNEETELAGAIGTGTANGGKFTRSNTQATGGGQPHNNLQPYITCYFWKRVA